MNRKKTSKIEKAIQKATATLAPMDDPLEWLGQRWEKAPWTEAQIAEFQTKIDSAFGGEGFVLAWSGDDRYWDSFYEDWHSTGLPKGELRKKPILLWAEVPVNEFDHLTIFPPRWLILEKLHPNEYAMGWEDASWVEIQGQMRRIRAERPPEAMYKVLRTIAEHEQPFIIGDEKPCCKRLRTQLMRLCYGKYRPPSDEDLAFIRGIRENMDAQNVTQRNDAPRSEKVLQHANASTQHYIKSAAMARTREVSQMIASDPYPYLVDVIKNKGITLTTKEIDECVAIGLEQARERREKELQI